MKKNKKRYWIIALICVVLVAGGIGLKTYLDRRNSSEQSIQTSKVSLGTITTTISGSGAVRSGQSSSINWQTSGTVATVNVQIGHKVAKGDVLATLDPTSLSTTIIQAQADLIDAQEAYDGLLKPDALEIAQAEANLTTAQENFDQLLNPTQLDIAEAESAVNEAQKALDTLKNPTALSIAQAETAVTEAQDALDSVLHPDQVAISNAEQAVLDAQSALADAQKNVDRLRYARASTDAIMTAQATYTLAQSEVDRLEKVYASTHGDPETDPAKARALSDLDVAEKKRDSALVTLNWYKSVWSETEIAERNTALALAQATLAEAQKTLDTLNNPTELDISLAEANLSDAQAALETLKNPKAVDLALAQAKVSVAQEALAKLKNPSDIDIELAKQQVVNAQETVDTLKNGASESDLTVAKSKITLAEATLAQAQITAPFSGTITDVSTLAGDNVSAGSSAFRIDDLSNLYVDLTISEVDISQIQVGLKATLEFDAISDRVYSGSITKVVMVATASNGVVNYPVTVQLTDADQAVLSGMTASVNLITAEASDVLVVPNKAIHSTGGQRTVTVFFEGQQITVPVTVGLVGDSMTEITSTGLKEGDLVVVATSTSTTSSSNTQNFGMQGGGVIMEFQGGGGPMMP